MSPLVSVIIPTYYRNNSLREAIESVESQTYSPCEIIVVDGTGEAHASSVVEDYDCRYVPQEQDKGAHAARSEGASRATGDYIQFLDDDDWLHATKFEKQLEVFENSEFDVGIVYCGRQTESGEVDEPREELRGNILDRALAFDGVPCLHSTMLIDADVLEQIMPLSNLHGADDTGMRIELAQITEFDFVDEVLVTAGESGYALGRTWDAIDGKRELLERYSHLYEDHDETIRGEALSEIHQKSGRRYLEERLWSARAIYCFAQAIRHNPNPSKLHFGEFVSSFAGRPGRNIAKAFQ